MSQFLPLAKFVFIAVAYHITIVQYIIYYNAFYLRHLKKCHIMDYEEGEAEYVCNKGRK